MRIILIGPPGVGKGTQAARLADALSVPAVSTGELFRAHVADETPLGLQIRDTIVSGAYLPDALTNDVVAQRLRADDAEHGFVLDGYPRTLHQISELDRLLAAAQQQLTAVLLLDAEQATVVERLRRRALSQGRPDDTVDVIRHRLDVYREQTAPLARIYEERGLLVRIDGEGSPADVGEQILRSLAQDPSGARRA